MESTLQEEVQQKRLGLVEFVGGIAREGQEVVLRAC